MKSPHSTDNGPEETLLPPAAEGKNVLIVDDDDQVRHVLTRLLQRSGYRTTEAANGPDAIDQFNRTRPDAVLLDLKMPGMDGMMVLQELKKIDESTPIIIITAHGDIPAAVTAIKLGAYDFISKPPEYTNLLTMVRRAVETGDLLRTVHRLRTDVASSIEHLLGTSAPIKAISAQIHKVAHSDFSVMIQGETGTGKSYIARIIHDLGKRTAGPFVMVDVGAIPETLLESELFGHEKGAFTGADRRKSGYFESANGGTLFIDELQNISPAMQGKLLASVEERRIRPLGSERPVDVDIRIICATNADLPALVRTGKVREDLYYRLGEFFISLPPLRERIDDIRFFARRFMDDAAEELDLRPTELSSDAVELLLSHPWPGNIRELKNVIRRAVLLSDGQVIRPEHVQFPATQSLAAVDARPAAAVPASTLAEREKQAILHAMDICGGVKTKAAEMLSIDYKTLLRKLKKYGITP